MEEGKILLIGNETDILHCGFSFPLSDGGKRYPSADHYAHSMILTQLNLDEVHILELLATPSSNVPQRAKELLQDNMPAGHDMNSLAQYLMTSRQSYTMAGLRLRADQDKSVWLLGFRQALMETNDALLIVCDRRDNELGIGMDDEEFVAFTRRIRADAETISQWMHDERMRPREIGQNQLGFFLMWLRYEIKEKERAKWMTTNEVKAKGISTDQDDQPIEISVSDFVIALQGIFQPLSNYYAMNFEIKGETYRSVEHYAYQRLFESLKFPYTEVMKIRTTVKPVDVSKLAKKILKSLNLDETELEHKLSRLDRWRQSAMKHKITKNELLQQLLLSTGHSILLETAYEGDAQWSCCTDEFEIQHLLTKKYVTPQLLIDWMCGRINVPRAVNYLGGNKTGLLLMELRTKFSVGCTHRIPLVSPLATNVVRTSLSNHLICFTPESVFHPFYSCEVRPTPDVEPLPSPIHYAAQIAIKFFNICQEDADWVMETKLGPECWSRLHYIINEKIMPPLDKIQQWYMTERQNAFKAAMQLQFEQNLSLLRMLIDTNDALLVSCARFSSTEAELNIGMRERDLRLWLSHVCIDSKSMIDLCLRPMAFRPPYLGGNRLGIILMEIRRDFILRGVFPQQLPELPISVDAALGSESPMENYVPHYTFDILNELNYTALWANVFLLMSKQDSQPLEFWNRATSKKTAPMFISVDETLINNVYDELLSRAKNERRNGSNHLSENGDNGSVAETNILLEDQTPEVFRAVFTKITAGIKEKLAEDENVQLNISRKSKENSRMQEVRRAVDRSRDQLSSTSATAKDSLQNYQWTPVSVSNSSPITSAANQLNPGHRSSSGGNKQLTGGNASPIRNRSSNDNSFNGSNSQNALESFLAAGGKIPSLLLDFTSANASGGSGFSAAATAILEKKFEKEFEKLLPRLAASAGGLSGLNAAMVAALDHQQQHHRKQFSNSGGNNFSGSTSTQQSYNRGGYGGRQQYNNNNSGGRRPPLSAANRSPSPTMNYRVRNYEDGNRKGFGSNQHSRRPDQNVSFQNKSDGGNQVPSANVEPIAKPPATKKLKRVVNESELSEGEILSDDDDAQ